MVRNSGSRLDLNIPTNKYRETTTALWDRFDSIVSQDMPRDMFQASMRTTSGLAPEAARRNLLKTGLRACRVAGILSFRTSSIRAL